MSENLSKNDRFFWIFFGFFWIFLGFPDFSGFFWIFLDFSGFLFRVPILNFLILYFFKFFYFFLFLFLIFLLNSGGKKIVPIFEISQGQCPRTGIFLLLHKMIVLAPFSSTVTKKAKQEAWEKIRTQLNGVDANIDSAKTLGDVLWANIRRGALKKVSDSKKVEVAS